MKLVYSLPLLGALVVRAYTKQQLTPAGLIVAFVTGVIHAVHPWSVFLLLLAIFFLAGTTVTKVKHSYKATLTSSSTGQNVVGASHPRGAAQVLCNSLPATICILIHYVFLDTKIHQAPYFLVQSGQTTCLPHPRPTNPSFNGPPSIANVLPYAILAHYAAVAADTFASELGILSSETPWLLTDLLRLFAGKMPRRVPRGTNGGVTFGGILASALGAGVIGVVAMFSMPFCKGRDDREELRTAYVYQYSADNLRKEDRQWLTQEMVILVGLTMAWGVAGGLLDSLLGAWFQASVVDVRTGRIVEGEGGNKVAYTFKEKDKSTDGKSGRKLAYGKDLLSNNGVNLMMCSIMAIAATVPVAYYMGINTTSLQNDWNGLMWLIKT